MAQVDIKPYSPTPEQSTETSSANHSRGFELAINSTQSSLQINTPSINLPKGGGAVKGIDEKFQVNAVTGTSSLSIPLPFSQSREGVPPLSLNYNSGSGNGAFGLGWTISVPAISRKTEKGLPLYRDEEESDTFMLAGMEDLVPMLEKQGDDWVRHVEQRNVNGIGYTIKRYRPRIEGAFARIEKWRNDSTGEVFWKTISGNNIHSYFGIQAIDRITDPADPSRVFQWMLSYMHDDKGSITLFKYKSEDFAAITKTSFEKNSINNCTQLYLKKICYGNKTPFYLGDSLPAENDFLFQTVVDYGEHEYADELHQNVFIETQPWIARRDAFSFFRAGFELRTYRRCRRILMFHCFGELPVNPCLTRALELIYDDDLDFIGSAKKEPGFSFLVKAKQSGYTWNTASSSYSSKSLPEMEIDYQQHEWNTTLQAVTNENAVHAPSGLQDKRYLWIDLFSEGISGILTEQGNAWHYKYNLGDGEFTQAVQVSSKPSLLGLDKGEISIQELNGDGSKYLVQRDKKFMGYFKFNDDDEWEPMKLFQQVPNIHLDTNTRSIDITGDGIPDLLTDDDNAFVWYSSLGTDGFAVPEIVYKSIDEEKGPAIVFNDEELCIFFADMNGDGLTDIVRIRNGETCYWPNQGYGKFGAKVTMANAPLFDHEAAFNPKYLRLADIDGSGPIDLIYLGKNDFRVWMNQNGNSWSESPHIISAFPPIHNMVDVSVLDFLGTGTACIVYSTGIGNQPMWYIDLMNGKKPNLLKGYRNNFGMEVSVEYKSSTHYYLEDKKEGKDWITRLPFPVHCVDKLTLEDKVRQTIFTTSYRYSHGYFDHEEREFRGFGKVVQRDTEDFSQFNLNSALNVVEEILHQAPVKTVSWFHNGAFFRNKKILDQYKEEYFQNDAFSEYDMPEIIFPDELTAEELREAHRACKGMTLRTEVYAEDDLPESQFPFNAGVSNAELRMVQPRGINKYACFLSVPSESITYTYDRDVADPRINHSLLLATDELGFPTKKAAVVYSRVTRPVGDKAIPDKVWAEQSKSHIVYHEVDYTNDIVEADSYRLRAQYESRGYEIGGINIAAGHFISKQLLSANIASATEILYEQEFTGGFQKRLSAKSRNYFYRDDLSGPMPLGQLSHLAIGHKSYSLAFTKNLVTKYYGSKVNDALLSQGMYVHSEGDEHWWAPTGELIFPANPENSFYVPTGARDVFGNVNTVTYDKYTLLLEKVTNPFNDSETAQNDYRTLSAVRSTDANLNRVAVETDELGMVIKGATMGKEGAGEGDTLDDPTGRMEYDLFNWKNNNKPNYIHSYIREKHGDPLTRWLESYIYSDGCGTVIMNKTQAEPGKAKRWNDVTKVLDEVDADPRWVGNGRTILNNKGNPVKKFEPYFSTTHEFESEAALVQSGFSAILYYDAVGRNIRTELPNGTFTKAVFDSWHFKGFDPNDTVKDSQWYVDRGSPDPDTDPEPTDAEQRAAWLSAKHHNTPLTVFTDSLGKNCYTITDYGSGKTAEAFSETDAAGRFSKVYDQHARLVSEGYSNLLGATIYGKTAEKGEKWVLLDVMGRMLKIWDNAIYQFRATFDKLHRPVATYVEETGVEKLVSFMFYGDSLPTAVQKNLKGRAYKIFDQAGEVVFSTIDFKGNALTAERRLAKSFNQTINWNVLEGLNSETDIDNAANPLLESEIFISSSTVDALNRAETITLPDDSIVRNTYNVGGFPDKIELQLRGQGVFQTFMVNQDYDAKGQRQFVKLGNGLITNYFYDPRNFRLTELITKKEMDSDSQASQHLFYTFDPVGNIVYSKDDSQQTHFFSNAVVKPESKFVYDAVYQLLTASGRELAGIGSADAQRNNSDSPFVNQLPHVNNLNAVRNYTEQYEYDEIGNIKKLQHIATGASWTQRYHYEYEDDATNNTNRLKTTSLPGDPDGGPFTATYSHDARGNITAMPHLPTANSLVWNFMDMLQDVNLGGGGTAHYIYGFANSRVRKVIEKPGGLRTERIYLGALEIYREYQNNNKRLERNTLHIADNTGKIAQVDTKLLDLDLSDPDNPLSTDLIRYQYSNHLGSAVMETAEDGTIISYEEFHPYGTSSYRSCKSGFNLSLKRYRFSGKERDDETGFYYFGARYYVPWLGRWTSCDPGGFVKGFNLFKYCSNNPVMYCDPNGMDDVRVVWRHHYTGEESFADLQRDVTAHGLHMRPGVTAENYRELWIPNEFGAGGSGGIWNVVGDEPFTPTPSTESGPLLLPGLNPGDVSVINLGSPIDLNGGNGGIIVLDPNGVDVNAPPPPPSSAPPPERRTGGVFVGILQIGGGVLELVAAGGLLLAPEPTMATKAGGIVLGAHALDTLGHGIASIATDEPQETFTQQAGEGVALYAGADPTTAHWIGVGTDVVAGAGPSLGVGISRRLAIRTLATVEAEGGAALTVGYLGRGGIEMGHNVVGVTRGGTTTWFHLAGDITAEGGVSFARRSAPSSQYLISTFAVDAAAADRAFASAGRMGVELSPSTWTFLGNNCSTTAIAVLREGGVTAPLWARTPSLVYFGVNYGYLTTSAVSGFTSTSTGFFANPRTHAAPFLVTGGLGTPNR